MDEFKLEPKIVEHIIREQFNLPEDIPEVMIVRYTDMAEYTQRLTKMIYNAALKAMHKQNEDNLHKINMN